MVETFKTQKSSSFFGGLKATPKASVTIDFPKEGENVSIGHYAIRITGNAGSRVEVSVNGSEWKGCRFADGYHWLDWNPNKSGSCKISARIQKGASSWETSEERRCVVLVAKIK